MKTKDRNRIRKIIFNMLMDSEEGLTLDELIESVRESIQSSTITDSDIKKVLLKESKTQNSPVGHLNNKKFYIIPK